MVRFRVPASTTNLGHGFDCLGIALGAANTITVDALPGGRIAAPGTADAGLIAMVARVRDACAAAWSATLPGLSVAMAGDVPIARGMGSSATVLLGVAAACRLLARGGDAWSPDDRAAVLDIAAGIEGHPDNVAAACLGGFTVVGPVDGRLRWARFAVPAGLGAVVAIPPFEVKTSEARRILPAQLDRADAVRAIQRTALITAALAGGDATLLRGLFADAWHERHRAPLNHGFAEARAAADAAGALGTIISGSGSCVLAFTPSAQAASVRAAMAESYRRLDIAAEVRAMAFDNRGLEQMS